MKALCILVCAGLTGCGGIVVIDGSSGGVGGSSGAGGAPQESCPSTATPYPTGAIITTYFEKFSVYPADGSATPLGTIAFPITPDGFTGLTFDRCGNLVTLAAPFGTPASGRIDVIAAGAFGNVKPLRTITGPHTRLGDVRKLVVDDSGFIYVTVGDVSKHGGGVLVFAPDADGDVAPVRTITHHESFWLPFGIALDKAGLLYVADAEETPILVFDRNADGNATPLRTFGNAEAKTDVATLAFDAEGNFYAGGTDPGRVFAFKPGAAHSTRVIDIPSTLGDMAAAADGRTLVAQSLGGVDLYSAVAHGHATPTAKLPGLVPVAFVP